ncbi:MAG: hypothetical protein K1X74_11945 [Pirellulales bacterium]|nr:hypothetical protein [Pirellulales bacterium]
MSEPSAAQRISIVAAYGSLCGLLLVPLLVVLDSAAAGLRGWSPRLAGTFGLLAYVAAGALLGGLVLASVSLHLRTWLAGNRSGCWVFGAASLLALIGAEGALDYLWPSPPFHLRTPQTRYVFEPEVFQLPGTSAVAQVSYNAHGIRGADWLDRAATYRMLCLGGSTTECIYIDDAATWPALLAAKVPRVADRNTWVGAAAVSEFGTEQHLRFMRESPLVGQVDCVIALVGVNDLVGAMLRLDARSATAPHWLKSRSIELGRYLWNGRLHAGYYYDHDGSTLRLRRLGRLVLPPGDFDLARETQEYSRRLRDLVEAAQARRVRLLLVTQPVLWNEFLGEEAAKRLWLARAELRPRSFQPAEIVRWRKMIDEFNAATFEVGRATGAEVVDAAASLSGWEANFYDDYHLNCRGCEQLAQVLAAWLREHTVPGPAVPVQP